MPVTFLSAAAQRQFVQQVCEAVRSGDLRSLRMAIITFSEILGRTEVERLLDEEVTLELEQGYIPAMLKMMLTEGDDFNSVVSEILSELAAAASKEGFTLGKDFSYGEDPETGQPFLRMTEATLLKLEALHSPAAWKNCRSYLRQID
jgi:cobalamin biosynthesis protein CobD/CbiB